MPKLKTHKGAQARIHVTGSGKLQHGKIGGSHLRRHKPKRTKRLYGEMHTISPVNNKRIKKLLPVGAR